MPLVVRLIIYFPIRSMFIKACVAKKIPMVDQLAEGLKLFGVIDAIKQHGKQMHKWFVADMQEEMTPDTLLSMIIVIFSNNEAKRMLKWQLTKPFVIFCSQYIMVGIRFILYVVQLRCKCDLLLMLNKFKCIGCAKIALHICKSPQKRFRFVQPC